MDIKNQYFRQNVLITGGLGFIGSNLARHLLELGSKVTIVDNHDPDSGANRFNMEDIKDEVQVVEADINDASEMKQLVEGQNYLFNLAGQASHVGSMKEPFKDLQVNTVGQLRLLEVCRIYNPAIRIVYAGTRQVYGRPSYLPVDERHLLTPLDNNGVSKRAGEMYHIVYNRVHDMFTCVLRMTNTYGPRMRIKDDSLNFVGWWVRRLLEDQPLQIFGDGSQLRDLNHVDDVVNALLVCACHPISRGKIYNLGGEPVSLLSLARLMIEVLGHGRYELVPYPESRKRIDIGDYYGDYDLFHRDTNWEPRLSLRDGLTSLFEYFTQYKDHYI
ncbi:MAG TPA: SDR family NAD(P)-dependent oxidoreductase [Anaerolineales bacterium]|nr:SDR family NAD(P)-dependent oxidoreductase [Anaerolineales bacterium]HNN12051.1 SDR family NAD(P)-dependent oxidoreductase [Anaerolineales bacterium]